MFLKMLLKLLSFFCKAFKAGHQIKMTHITDLLSALVVCITLREMDGENAAWLPELRSPFKQMFPKPFSHRIV